MPQKLHNGIGTKKISAAQGLQPSLAADLEMGTFIRRQNSLTNMVRERVCLTPPQRQ